MNDTTLRTSDDRFEGLPDWPYISSYTDVGSVRVAYVDEGPRKAPTFLCVHGQPTWSYR